MAMTTDHDTQCQTDPCINFIKQTYKMINTCDPNIACWSNDGQSFIIKESEIFATTFITKFFNSNKLEYFIRQLYLHGFRKIKTDEPISSLKEKTSNHMRFCHDKFIRGRLDLLGEIQRTPGQESQTNQIKSLMTTKRDLKNTVALLHRRISQVKSYMQIINAVHDDRKRRKDVTELSNAHKRRKIDTNDDDIASDRDYLISLPEPNLSPNILTSKESHSISSVNTTSTALNTKDQTNDTDKLSDTLGLSLNDVNEHISNTTEPNQNNE